MAQFEPLKLLLDELPVRFDIPACDCAVTIDGKTVFRHGAGFSDAAKSRPVSPLDTYWAYSATKLFTCTAALQLVEQGKLQLLSPVYDYLPAFKELLIRSADGHCFPANRPLLVKHLFTMTSGLDYDLTRPAFCAAIKNSSGSTQDLVNALARDPLRFEPGTHFLYSMSHDVLGAIIEVVSNESLGEYIHSHITQPLGMSDVTFHPSPDQIRRLSTQYAHTGPHGAAVVIFQDNPYRFTPRYESGGAGLLCTVDDYIKLPAALSCGGKAANGYQLLHPETVKLMSTPQLDPIPHQDFLMRSPADHAFNYGLGVRVLVDTSNSTATAGQFGWDGAAGAFVIVDPTHHAAMFYAQHVCQSQRTFQELHPLLRETLGSCLQK